MSDNQNNTHILETVDSASDLGIMFDKNLKFDEHIDSTVNKVNKIIGLIKRKFTHMDKDLFLTLYKSLVRSKLMVTFFCFTQLPKSTYKSWRMPNVGLPV